MKERQAPNQREWTGMSVNIESHTSTCTHTYRKCTHRQTHKRSYTITHACTDAQTYLCLFRSEDCSLQSNADHVHTEVDGMHHCTILFGLQGGVGDKGGVGNGERGEGRKGGRRKRP